MTIFGVKQATKIEFLKQETMFFFRIVNLLGP